MKVEPHKKRARALIALVLTLVLFVGVIQMPANAVDIPDQKQVYNSMIALKSQYPEGTVWTDLTYYKWKGGAGFSGGFGCAGFAMLLSDAAFGTTQATKINNFSYNQVRVGDIVRVNNNTHFVIVLEKYSDHVIVAEGNYNFSVHWGRSIPKSEIAAGSYILTRYKNAPSNTPAPQPAPDPASKFVDIPANADYIPAVNWAVQKGITNGTSATTFSPNGTCTRGQAVTFLWRASGCPNPRSTYNPFKDVAQSAYYYKAVLWAVEKGITVGTSNNTFSPNLNCTKSQILTFLWRANGSPNPGNVRNPFWDVNSNTFYYKAVLWASSRNIETGSGYFRPNDPCVRSLMVTYLYRNLG